MTSRTRSASSGRPVTCVAPRYFHRASWCRSSPSMRAPPAALCRERLDVVGALDGRPPQSIRIGPTRPVDAISGEGGRVEPLPYRSICFGRAGNRFRIGEVLWSGARCSPMDRSTGRVDARSRRPADVEQRMGVRVRLDRVNPVDAASRSPAQLARASVPKGMVAVRRLTACTHTGRRRQAGFTSAGRRASTNCGGAIVEGVTTPSALPALACRIP